MNLVEYKHHVGSGNRAKLKHDGLVVFMCPDCYELTYYVANNCNVDITPVLNTDSVFADISVEVKCYHCKQTHNMSLFEDSLDINIAPMISELNKKGYRTIYSCEGHDHTDDSTDLAYVMFDKKVVSSEKYINFMDQLKDINIHTNSCWEFDDDWKNAIIIREVFRTEPTYKELFDNKHKETLTTLKNWVNSLPKIKIEE